MATIGQQLATPETGWRRYDDTDSRFLYSSNLTHSSGGAWYNGTFHQAVGVGSIDFKFHGTKLRIISAKGSRSNNIKITIDGIDYSYSEAGTLTYKALVFEQLNLSMGVHTVRIENQTTNAFALDAIDLDDMGYLVHPTLNQVSSLVGMQVGDCIPCKYIATTSGSTGTFSELGTCTAVEIPVTGSAAPDGLFYFIKTDKGTLIADRVIQTNISWDILNAAGLIEGAMPLQSQVPYLTSNTNGNITISASSCYGGLAYAYYAFDSIMGNYWYSQELTNAWIKVDFGEQKLIKTVKLQTYTSLGYQFKNFKIEGSNDNNTWDSLYTGKGPNVALAWVTCRLNITQSYRYYRIIILDTYGDVAIIQKIKFFTEDTLKIRSLSSGCAYADASGNKSTTDQSKGAWPIINEWDKYIVNSDLKSKITKGDDNIWHWNSYLGSWCKDTPITGVSFSANIGANVNRVARSAINGSGTTVLSACSFPSNLVHWSLGFRPVLEYIEPDGSSKQTTLWY